jgi:hypothetical protein
MDPLVGILTIIGCLLLLLACFGWGQPRIGQSIAQWGKSVDSLDEPADLFYARVYQRLRENLTAAGLPDSRVGFGPGHLFANRTIFGARPQYLMVRYSHLTIYLYAFRLPQGLYVSYWAFSKYTLWQDHPILKWVLFWRMYQMTLYQFDLMDMCLATINGALHEVIDEYCEERGLKPLEEFERRPVLQGFYAKYKHGPSGQSTLPPTSYVLPVQFMSPQSTPNGQAPLTTPHAGALAVGTAAPAATSLES